MHSVRPKIAELKFNVFARMIHPELFSAFASREFNRSSYQLHVHITSDGHLIQFRASDLILTEVCAGTHHPLPTGQRLISEPIEKASTRRIVTHQQIQLESEFEFEGVSPKTFLTIQQQLDDRNPREGLVQEFDASGRIPFGAVSYINVQSFAKHAIVRCFHTFPDTCAIMKSETKICLFDLNSIGESD